MADKDQDDKVYLRTRVSVNGSFCLKANAKLTVRKGEDISWDVYKGHRRYGVSGNASELDSSACHKSKSSLEGWPFVDAGSLGTAMK
jgi:hypothetical protein